MVELFARRARRRGHEFFSQYSPFISGRGPARSSRRLLGRARDGGVAEPIPRIAQRLLHPAVQADRWHGTDLGLLDAKLMAGASARGAEALGETSRSDDLRPAPSALFDAAALQRRGDAAGQHPVRQGGLRPSAKADGASASWSPRCSQARAICARRRSVWQSGRIYQVGVRRRAADRPRSARSFAHCRRAAWCSRPDVLHGRNEADRAPRQRGAGPASSPTDGEPQSRAGRGLVWVLHRPRRRAVRSSASLVVADGRDRPSRGKFDELNRDGPARAALVTRAMSRPGRSRHVAWLKKSRSCSAIPLFAKTIEPREASSCWRLHQRAAQLSRRASWLFKRGDAGERRLRDHGRRGRRRSCSAPMRPVQTRAAVLTRRRDRRRDRDPVRRAAHRRVRRSRSRRSSPCCASP